MTTYRIDYEPNGRDYEPDGQPDEVFFHNPKAVHIERMADNDVWMRVHLKDKAFVCHFSAKNKVRWTIEDDTP